jgi:hypothetical protein
MSEVNTATRPAGPSLASRLARLRMASFGAVTMLIIQFILGIVYNLYGTAPTASKSVGLFSSPVLALHVIMSLLLLIAAVMLLVRAVGARHRLTIWMSAVGLTGIVAAGGAGIAFAGHGAAGSSLGMSIAFAVSLASYVVILVFVPAQ